MAGIVAEADCLLVASNIRRACNDKGAKDLLSLPLRKVLLESGYAGQVGFVATQSDVFNPSEIIDNLKLPPEATPLQCALARKCVAVSRSPGLAALLSCRSPKSARIGTCGRSSFTKEYLTKSFYRALPHAMLPAHRPPPLTWQRLGFELPIFTVSATDYMLWQEGRADERVRRTAPLVNTPGVLYALPCCLLDLLPVAHPEGRGSARAPAAARLHRRAAHGDARARCVSHG